MGKKIKDPDDLFFYLKNYPLFPSSPWKELKQCSWSREFCLIGALPETPVSSPPALTPFIPGTLVSPLSSSQATCSAYSLSLEPLDQIFCGSLLVALQATTPMSVQGGLHDCTQQLLLLLLSLLESLSSICLLFF